MTYKVIRTETPPAWDFDWEAWNNAQTAEIDFLLPESSCHKPKTSCRFMHDNSNIYGIFKVEDNYIQVTHVGYQQEVCKDSCVEFFFKPHVGPGYFNLEMNAGASFLLYYVRDFTPKGEFYEDYDEVNEVFGKQITVKTTMPQTVLPEITTPTTWFAQLAIPVNALEEYCGKIGCLNGLNWTCNFYKCGDDTSHPHWVAWKPVPECNFHLPYCFGKMELL